MASYGWEGLAEGLSPFAQELFKSRIAEGKENRKPSAQLQRGLLDAIRSMSQAPTTADLQAGSDEAERNAALTNPGGRLDLNSAIQGMAGGASPEMVGQANQGKGFVDTLQKLGITSLGGDAIGMNRYGNSTVQTGYFDPDTKEFVYTGEVPRGSVIKSAASSVDTTRNKALARGEGYTEGRLNVAGLPQEQAIAINENEAVVRSADNLLNLYDKNPGLFESSSMPGARLGDDLMKEVVLWRENLKTHRALSIGGKTLTANEIQRVDATLGSLIRGEPVSRKAIEEVRTLAQGNLMYMKGSWAEGRGGAEDFSSMSDDELRAIAGGQ